MPVILWEGCESTRTASYSGLAGFFHMVGKNVKKRGKNQPGRNRFFPPKWKKLEKIPQQTHAKRLTMCNHKRDM